MSKILYLDQGGFMRNFVALFFRSKGVSIETSVDYHWSNFEYDLRKERPDILIIEPRRADEQVITIIKNARLVFPEMKIVCFAVASYDEEVMPATKKAGIDDYVGKGLGPSLLYERLCRRGDLERPIEDKSLNVKSR